MNRNVSSKIVLTGGPGAGKTTLTQVIAHVFEKNVVVVPEAASLLFSGGFPRWPQEEARMAAQRAVFHVQQELEAAYSVRYPDKLLILDRGTVDGAVYWPAGPADFFKSIGSSAEAELGRYRRVFYLESAEREDYEANLSKNPNRTESWDEARRLDAEMLKLWSRHPAMSLIRNQRAFSTKIYEVLKQVESEIQAWEGKP